MQRRVSRETRWITSIHIQPEWAKLKDTIRSDTKSWQRNLPMHDEQENPLWKVASLSIAYKGKGDYKDINSRS